MWVCVCVCIEIALTTPEPTSTFVMLLDDMNACMKFRPHLPYSILLQVFFFFFFLLENGSCFASLDTSKKKKNSKTKKASQLPTPNFRVELIKCLVISLKGWHLRAAQFTLLTPKHDEGLNTSFIKV